MTTEIAKYDLETAVLAELDTKYKDFSLDPDNVDSKAMLMAGLRDYRNMRLAVVEWHKVQKADIVKIGRALDSEKARVIDLISPGENHLKAIRKAEDDRLAAIEKKRIDSIRTMINDIRNMDYKLPELNLKEMQSLKAEVESTPILEEEYQEFVGEAMASVHNVLIAINNAIEQRVKFDLEKAERKAENERFEKIRKEQEATQAKIDADEKRLKEEKEEKDAIDKSIEDQKEWFKKHIKGDSFQTPTVDDIEKAISALQTITNHEVHEPSIKLLLDEQVIEADGILKFRKEQAKLQEEKDKLAAEKMAEENRKKQEEFERQAKINAEQEAAEKMQRELDEEAARLDAKLKEEKSQAALMPDKNKILDFCDLLDDLTPPRCKNEKGNIILNLAMKEIYAVSGKIRAEIEEL